MARLLRDRANFYEAPACAQPVSACRKSVTGAPVTDGRPSHLANYRLNGYADTPARAVPQRSVPPALWPWSIGLAPHAAAADHVNRCADGAVGAGTNVVDAAGQRSLRCVFAMKPVGRRTALPA